MKKEKQYWFPIGTSAEGDCSGWIHLTETEAKIVAYASNSCNWECVEDEGYSGHLWIDLQRKQTKKPMSAPEPYWWGMNKIG